MKLKKGDIFRHKDGTLYLCTTNASQTNNKLQFVVNLGQGSASDSPNYLKEVILGDYDSYLTHTGINICDLIKKVNNET